MPRGGRCGMRRHHVVESDERGSGQICGSCDGGFRVGAIQFVQVHALARGGPPALCDAFTHDGLPVGRGRGKVAQGLVSLRELQSRPRRLHHALEHNKTPSKAQGPDPGRMPGSGPTGSRITATIKRVQVTGRSSGNPPRRDFRDAIRPATRACRSSPTPWRPRPGAEPRSHRRWTAWAWCP